MELEAEHEGEEGYKPTSADINAKSKEIMQRNIENGNVNKKGDLIIGTPQKPKHITLNGDIDTSKLQTTEQAAKKFNQGQEKLAREEAQKKAQEQAKQKAKIQAQEKAKQKEQNTQPAKNQSTQRVSTRNNQVASQKIEDTSWSGRVKKHYKENTWMIQASQHYDNPYSGLADDEAAGWGYIVGGIAAVGQATVECAIDGIKKTIK